MFTPPRALVTVRKESDKKPDHVWAHLCFVANGARSCTTVALPGGQKLRDGTTQIESEAPRQALEIIMVEGSKTKVFSSLLSGRWMLLSAKVDGSHAQACREFLLLLLALCIRALLGVACVENRCQQRRRITYSLNNVCTTK